MPDGDVVTLRPHAGPQEQFLSSAADIGVYGGAAGGGKTRALVLEPLRHIAKPDFACAMFRREGVDFRGKGGLWTETEKVYPLIGGVGREPILQWDFPSGAQIHGYHLENEKDKLKHQGKEYALILYDELTHFTETQFFYLLSRNRSTCGMRPYVRATCNPDPDSWVAEFLAWWIDQDEDSPTYGQPIPERAGVLRWMLREGDDIHWGDSPEELQERFPHLFDGFDDPRDVVLSVTFIPARLDDNPTLTKADPGYRAKLRALPRVERARLEGGNWKTRAAAGAYFRREWFDIVDRVPDTATRRVRRWDFAATEPSAQNPDPDWTVGVRMAVDVDGTVYIEDVVRDRLRPHGVKRLARHTAEMDGRSTAQRIEQEPGASGVSVADDYRRTVFYGLDFKGVRSITDKEARAGLISSAAEGGMVKIVRAAWNTAFLSELEAFPTKGVHDDQVDAASGAFYDLTARGPLAVGSVDMT